MTTLLNSCICLFRQPSSADTPTAKRVIAAILKAFVGFGVVVIAYELIVWVHAPALAFGVSALGRNRHCGTWDGYRGLVDLASQRALIEKIAQSSKLLRKDKDLNLYRTLHGEFWIPKGSDEVLPKLLAQQQAQIYGAVQPGDVVIDCGAHVGTYSRQALASGAKLVVAVEPAPDNVECLRRAFASDIHAGRMIVVPKGVWHKEDSLPFYSDPANSAADSFVIKGTQDQVLTNVPLTTIDQLVKDLKLEKVTLIKMDIKGATLNALQGAHDLVQRDHPRIVISTEEEADEPQAVIAKIRELDGRYRQQCGICSINGALMLSPDVLLFQ